MIAPNSHLVSVYKQKLKLVLDQVAASKKSKDVLTKLPGIRLAIFPPSSGKSCIYLVIGKPNGKSGIFIENLDQLLDLIKKLHYPSIVALAEAVGQLNSELNKDSESWLDELFSQDSEILELN